MLMRDFANTLWHSRASGGRSVQGRNAALSAVMKWAERRAPPKLTVSQFRVEWLETDKVYEIRNLGQKGVAVWREIFSQTNFPAPRPRYHPSAVTYRVRP